MKKYFSLLALLASLNFISCGGGSSLSAEDKDFLRDKGDKPLSRMEASDRDKALDLMMKIIGDVIEGDIPNSGCYGIHKGVKRCAEVRSKCFEEVKKNREIAKEKLSSKEFKAKLSKTDLNPYVLSKCMEKMSDLVQEMKRITCETSAEDANKILMDAEGKIGDKKAQKDCEELVNRLKVVNE